MSHQPAATSRGAFERAVVLLAGTIAFMLGCSALFSFSDDLDNEVDRIDGSVTVVNDTTNERIEFQEVEITVSGPSFFFTQRLIEVTDDDGEFDLDRELIGGETGSESEVDGPYFVRFDVFAPGFEPFTQTFEVDADEYRVDLSDETRFFEVDLDHVTLRLVPLPGSA